MRTFQATWLHQVSKPTAELREPPFNDTLRVLIGRVVIVVAVGQQLGHALSSPSLMGYNDISRWCTVWSLVERGTYAIDDCPWVESTIDKVYGIPFPGGPGTPGRGHYYSSKPPLLSTLGAMLILPVKYVLGMPMNRVYFSSRASLRLPAYVIYYKAMLIIFNVIPYCVFLVIYSRYLASNAVTAFGWLVSLAAAAWATPLTAFGNVYNNHTVAAYSLFFGFYCFLQIWNGAAYSRRHFIASGLFAAFGACNELSGILLGLFIFVVLLRRHPRRTLGYFAPAAAVPCLAFLVTHYIALGSLIPAYFGTLTYYYPSSYWLAPQGLDAIREPKTIYLFNMTFGHHGILSLTPIFLFSFYAIVRGWMTNPPSLRLLSVIAAIMTVDSLLIYLLISHNYGGGTAAMRWLMWLFPLWLLHLPEGLDRVADSRWLRRLALATLAISVFSIAYALRTPWSHPWILDAAGYLGLYRI